MTSTLRPPAAPPPPPPDPAPPARSTERVLARRPALPGGRAVVGALLIVSAAIGTFVVATGGDDGPTTSYPVLRRAVDPGESLGDALEWRAMALDPAVEARTFVEPSELEHAIALTPLAEGELVQRSQVAATGSTSGGLGGQVSIPVPADRTPPNLRRGERVAVLATYGSGTDATTIVTVHEATVLSHDTKGEAIGSSATSRLTLALDDPTAVVATAHAAQVAELTIVRTSAVASALPSSYRRDDPARSAPSTLADLGSTGASEPTDG